MDQGRTHPIFIIAGIAVLLFSLLGIAALTGTLPAAKSKADDPAVFAQGAAIPPPPGKAAPAENKARSGAPSKPLGAPAVPCATCGVIEAIRPAEVQSGTSGVGAVAGGVAGALIGNQFGHGTGRTLLTLGGAAGGAYAGNSVEKHVNKRTIWRVTVRLEDGSVRTLSQSVQPPFAVGDRVRVVNGSSLERA